MGNRAWMITAAATLTLCTAVPAAAAPSAPAAPEEGEMPLRQAVQQLREAPEHRAGYERNKFGSTWIDADHNGCNTRAEVLLEEAIKAPTRTGRCTLSGGEWYSYYTDTYVAKTDIDHLVPLAEAWDSGASEWTREKRVDYANDLRNPEHLVAVSQASNRSKADKDVAQWLPPYQAARCRYVTAWVGVKRIWHLAVDEAEKNTLARLAGSCPDVPVPSHEAR